MHAWYIESYVCSCRTINKVNDCFSIMYGVKSRLERLLPLWVHQVRRTKIEKDESFYNKACTCVCAWFLIIDLCSTHILLCVLLSVSIDSTPNIFLLICSMLRQYHHLLLYLSKAPVKHPFSTSSPDVPKTTPQSPSNLIYV